jgi:hypothetical protein
LRTESAGPPDSVHVPVRLRRGPELTGVENTRKRVGNRYISLEVLHKARSSTVPKPSSRNANWSVGPIGSVGITLPVMTIMPGSSG